MQLFIIRKTNWLTLLKEIIAVYIASHTKLINTKWWIDDWRSRWDTELSPGFNLLNIWTVTTSMSVTQHPQYRLLFKSNSCGIKTTLFFKHIQHESTYLLRGGLSPHSSEAKDPYLKTHCGLRYMRLNYSRATGKLFMNYSFFGYLTTLFRT
jgi:hypothetical protein